MKVLIFTEGGSQIGLGHISRCSSLYDELNSRGIDVEFIVYGDLDHSIIGNRNSKLINWLSIDFLNQYIKEDHYCIVDSYLANQELYKAISKLAKRCLFIDDDVRIKYPKGIITNPSLSIEEVNYPINSDQIYLLGPKYIILRRPFINPQRLTINIEVKEVLISMGGSDLRNLTPLILKQFASEYQNIQFNVVISDAYKNIDEIQRFNFKNINLFKSVSGEEMKDIMLKSDIAITAAGQTIYELISTKTPFIPIKIIENQSNNMTGLTKLNLIETVLDYQEKDFIKRLEIEFNRLLNLDRRKQKFYLYRNLIDGLGSMRLVNKLLGD